MVAETIAEAVHHISPGRGPIGAAILGRWTRDEVISVARVHPSARASGFFHPRG